MIPLRLQLKNFLSYGAELQTIDFEPYHLICLSGKNGHGKSALLDAITWAIWGQARKQAGNAKADQGLLRLGQKQMMVIFDFIFNDQTYRIRREFALTHGKPYAALEFGILNRETDAITPLTDKTIRATQAKINQMLGLDYDAFTNSAFLRQGHANEFSKKSPKERKTILAQIIGLERFETLKKAAHETAREKAQKKSEFERLSQRLEQELEKQDELKKLMAEVAKNLTAHETNQEKIKKEQEALEQKKKKLNEDKQSYALIAQQIAQIKNEYATTEQTFHTQASQWRTTHKQLLALGDTNSLQQEKKDITQTISGYQKKLQQSFNIKKELLQIQQEQQKIYADLKAQHTSMVSTKKAEIEVLQGQQKAIEQQRTHIHKEYEMSSKELAKLTTRINEHQKKINASITEEKLQTLEKQFEKGRSYYHKWVARANMLSQKKKDIHQKKALSSDNAQPSCPLCEQNLSASRKRFLLAKFDTEHTFLAHQLQRLTGTLKNLKIALLDEHAKLEAARKTIKNNHLAQATLKELLKAQKSGREKQKEYLKQSAMLEKESQKIGATIEQKRKELGKFSDSSSLTKDHKAYQEISLQTEKLSKQLEQTQIDENVYIAATKKLETVEKQLESLETITAQKHQQEQRKAIVFQAAKRIRDLANQKDTQNSKLKMFGTLANDEKQITAHAQELEKQTQTVSHARSQMLEQKGRLEAQLAKLAQYAQEQKEHQKTIKRLMIEIDEYQIIAGALGKDGIQALLIEDTIPEIEQEANDLLAKLTDNQSQIFIESLKDLKKGGTKETLDIKISDAAGIRPYEMFSGGEAFRIDFALRIAISKLLARRAGTSLQTLIIDEGFGSQDEEGLAHIMDAIYKIQDDFSKVMIVSHLPAMKNQFPVHFVVQKTAQGSVIRVMEQG